MQETPLESKAPDGHMMQKKRRPLPATLKREGEGGEREREREREQTAEGIMKRLSGLKQSCIFSPLSKLTHIPAV